MQNTQATSAASVNNYAMYVRLYTVGEHLAHCDMETMEEQYANDWKCDPSLLWPVSDSDDVHEIDADEVMKLKSEMTPVTHVAVAKHLAQYATGHRFVTVYADSDGVYWVTNEDITCPDWWAKFGKQYDEKQIAKQLAAQAA